MIRRSWFAIVAMLFHAALIAGAQAEVVQGRDYTLVTPAQPVGTPGKIEVIEFFSYGCPHCANFHPTIMKWADALPEDTEFVRVPVAFGRQQWGQLVRAYYALQASGDFAKLDHALFDAIHKERKPLFNEANLSAWVASQGGDAKRFRDAFNAFDVSRQASQGEQLSRDYRVSGVPQLAVNGKYLVIGDTFEDMLRIAGELIERERAQSSNTKR